jgi:hypothetical protein
VNVDGKPQRVPSMVAAFARIVRYRVDRWLESNGFYRSAAISRGEVYFELTLQEKLARIGSMQCSHFIDDLPELLLEPNFPKSVERMLFAPQTKPAADFPFQHVSSWAAVRERLISREPVCQ